MKVAFVLLVVAVFTVHQVESWTFLGCWEAWSRCTSWSSGGSGILWQTCQDRCHCLGYSRGGSCQIKSYDTRCASGKSYYCACTGWKDGNDGSHAWWCGF